MVSNGEQPSKVTLIIMTDPIYSGDFFLDPGITVKQEPYSLMDTSTTQSVSSTASVPIPGRKNMDISDFNFGDFDAVHSPSLPDGGNGMGGQLPATPEIYPTMGINSMWSTRLIGGDSDLNIKSDRMDDDDIFQVDKADLIQGPTLAELNANDDTFLGDLSFDDLLLPDENSFCITIPTGGFNYQQHGLAQKFSVLGGGGNMSPMLATANNNNSANATNNNNGGGGGGGGEGTITLTTLGPTANLGFYKDSFDPTGSIPGSPYDPFLSKTPVTAFSPTSQNSSTSSLVMASTASPPSALQQKHSTLHELLLRREGYNASPEGLVLGQSVPVAGPSSPVPSTGNFVRASRSHPSRLSSSAPTHLGLDQIWQRREPRKHLLSTGSLAEAGSTSSLSTGGVLSPEGPDFSQDEDYDSDEDSDHYEDFSSDNDSDDDPDERGSRTSLSGSSKKERYFWQYNVQAKGPKGQRLVLKTKQEDPHVLNEVTDPVFSPNCSVRGIKHSGKARKGDGNDLTPNPRKLCSIGKELDKLSRIINDMTPVSELPFNVRPKTRKEKNKLASRACRLKKKAQHEANKIKLFGLEHEHKRLITGINNIKELLVTKFMCTSPERQEELTKQIERIVKSATKIKIGGTSTEYVNKVIDKVKSGIPSGGLEQDF